MTLEVIGAGFGRTGTLSLKLALERLGMEKCYHMLEVMHNEGHAAVWQSAARGEEVDWDRLFAGYQASVDWPSCNFWEAQLQHFPNAKVILTRRDPERWYASVMNTIYPSSVARREQTDPAIRKHMDMVFEVIWDGLFEGRMDDKEHVVAIYNAHNQHVIDTLPPEKLLVFEASDGWEPLCGFLDLPVPDEPYPWVNSTEDFRARVAAASAEPPQQD